MFPILFSFGNISLATSSLIITIGFITALFSFWKKTRVEIIEEEKIFDFILVLILSSLVFGRIVYVLEHMNDFGFMFDRFIHIYKYPGFNIWGLCFGGILGSFIYFKRVIKSRSSYLFDSLAIALSLFFGFVFVGFFFDGIYVGQPTGILGLRFVGVAGTRFPLQLPAAFLFFVFYFVAAKTNLKKANGFLFWLFCTYFFTIFLALEFLRRDRIYFEGIVLNKFTFFLISLFSGIIFTIKYKNNLINNLKKLWPKKRFSPSH